MIIQKINNKKYAAKQGDVIVMGETADEAIINCLLTQNHENKNPKLLRY